MTRQTRILLLALLALIAACRIHGKEQPHRPIGEDAAQLRASFNADLGKVRVLMLVAPT
jgi:hypothetical protein